MRAETKAKMGGGFLYGVMVLASVVMAVRYRGDLFLWFMLLTIVGLAWLAHSLYYADRPFQPSKRFQVEMFFAYETVLVLILCAMKIWPQLRF